LLFIGEIKLEGDDGVKERERAEGRGGYIERDSDVASNIMSRIRSDPLKKDV
jgi:hypothetical protein